MYGNNNSKNRFMYKAAGESAFPATLSSESLPDSNRVGSSLQKGALTMCERNKKRIKTCKQASKHMICKHAHPPRHQTASIPALRVLVPIRCSVDVALGAVGPEDGAHLLRLPTLIGGLPPWQ